MARTISNNERYRLLAMLADHPAGCTERLLLTHGFRLKLIAELTGKGLARACLQLSKIVRAASCTPARKFLASLS
jgi:hypothetical protein